MSIQNEDRKPTDNMEKLKQEASACGPGCGCHAGGSSNRVRWIVGVIIILAAGVLVARAMIKNNGASAEKVTAGFASLQTIGQAPAPAVEAISITKEAPTPIPGAGPTTSPRTLSLFEASGPLAANGGGRLPGDAATKETPAAVAVLAPTTTEAPAASDSVIVKEIGALTELNMVAADTGGVFVFLAGTNEPAVKAPITLMRSAAKTIESQASVKIGIFTLKPGSRDYAQISMQMPVPGVLAMVKGRGMSAVSGEITEPKLIQGFVAASSAGGCGPSSGGCGPAGCN